MSALRNRIGLYAAMLLLALALFGLPSQAFAADPIDVDKECSLSVNLANGNVPAEGVEFRVYRIAEVSRAVEFTPVESFSSYGIDLEEPNAETYRQLAALLPGHIAADGVFPSAATLTDTDGFAKFSGLETGLYLVVGDVHHGYREYLTPDAFVVSLPQRLEDETWEYNVTSQTKYSLRPDTEPVSLEVLKVWSGDESGDRPESVSIELYDGSNLHDTIVLSKANNWSYRWDDLYGDTLWSVREVKAPNGYTVSVDRQDDRFVITNTATKSASYSEKLPQTGVLWWPVPVLALAGCALIALGVRGRNSAR